MFHSEIIDDFSDILLCSETDLSGKITYVTDAYCKISGYSKEELIGHNHNIVRNPGNDPKIFEDLWSNLKSGKTFLIDRLSNSAKDGSIYFTKNKFVPKYENNEVVGYRSIQINITNEVNDELEKAIVNANYLKAQHSNEQLKQNLKEKEESLLTFKNNFVSLFTHELKTPLNVIINFSDFIRRILEKNVLNEKNSRKIQELAVKIYNNGLKQQLIIDHLLDFAQIESGRLEVKKKYFLLNTVLEPIIKQFQGLYNKEVVYEIPNDSYVYSDPKIYGMMFSNLYSNALKYSKSKVKISFIRFDDDFILSVEDDGDGIKNENKLKVFEFFGQSNQGNVLKMENIGTGIGLYTVKLLADICDKKIVLTDSAELGGAKFIIKGNKDND